MCQSLNPSTEPVPPCRQAQSQPASQLSIKTLLRGPARPIQRPLSCPVILAAVHCLPQPQACLLHWQTSLLPLHSHKQLHSQSQCRALILQAPGICSHCIPRRVLRSIQAVLQWLMCSSSSSQHLPCAPHHPLITCQELLNSSSSGQHLLLPTFILQDALSRSKHSSSSGRSSSKPCHSAGTQCSLLGHWQGLQGILTHNRNASRGQRSQACSPQGSRPYQRPCSSGRPGPARARSSAQMHCPKTRLSRAPSTVPPCRSGLTWASWFSAREDGRASLEQPTPHSMQVHTIPRQPPASGLPGNPCMRMAASMTLQVLMGHRISLLLEHKARPCPSGALREDLAWPDQTPQSSRQARLQLRASARQMRLPCICSGRQDGSNHRWPTPWALSMGVLLTLCPSQMPKQALHFCNRSALPWQDLICSTTPQAASRSHSQLGLPRIATIVCLLPPRVCCRQPSRPSLHILPIPCWLIQQAQPSLHNLLSGQSSQGSFRSGQDPSQWALRRLLSIKGPLQLHPAGAPFSNPRQKSLRPRPHRRSVIGTWPPMRCLHQSQLPRSRLFWAGLSQQGMHRCWISRAPSKIRQVVVIHSALWVTAKGLDWLPLACQCLAQARVQSTCLGCWARPSPARLSSRLRTKWSRSRWAQLAQRGFSLRLRHLALKPYPSQGMYNSFCRSIPNYPSILGSHIRPSRSGCQRLWHIPEIV